MKEKIKRKEDCKLPHQDLNLHATSSIAKRAASYHWAKQPPN